VRPDDGGELATAPFDMAFVGYVSLGDVTLGYSAVCRAFEKREGAEISLEPESLTLKKAQILRLFPQSYEKFVDDAVSETGFPKYYALPVPAS